jgi:hypothetical protein
MPVRKKNEKKPLGEKLLGRDHVRTRADVHLYVVRWQRGRRSLGAAPPASPDVDVPVLEKRKAVSLAMKLWPKEKRCRPA